jgi:hypothetical protein
VYRSNLEDLVDLQYFDQWYLLHPVGLVDLVDLVGLVDLSYLYLYLVDLVDRAVLVHL